MVPVKQEKTVSIYTTYIENAKFKVVWVMSL